MKRSPHTNAALGYENHRSDFAYTQIVLLAISKFRIRTLRDSRVQRYELAPIHSPSYSTDRPALMGHGEPGGCPTSAVGGVVRSASARMLSAELS